MSAPRKPSAVRKRRRFSARYGQSLGAQFARTYGLTPEAGDFLGALQLCDEYDLASALLVVHAMADVAEANAGSADQGTVVERLAELRQWTEQEGGAPQLWETIARDVRARCDF